MDSNSQKKVPRGSNQEPNEGGGWQALLGIAAAVAGVAAGAYLISRSIREESTSGDDEDSYSSGVPTLPCTESFNFLPNLKIVPSMLGVEKTDNCPTLAVDATPNRGGGILRMCNGGRKTVHYYSVDWSHYFKFLPHESDKFEMVNALLALLTFKQQIETIEFHVDFVVKTDNNYCITKQYSDPEDDRILQRFKRELKSVNGNIEKMSQGFDRDMKNANQLSKGGYRTWIRDELPKFYVDYELRDMSVEVMRQVENTIDIIPEKYHKS